MISQFGHAKHKSNLVRNLNSLVFKVELALGKSRDEAKIFHVCVTLVINLRSTSPTQKKKNCVYNLFNTTKYHLHYISIHSAAEFAKFVTRELKNVELGELGNVVKI